MLMTGVAGPENLAGAGVLVAVRENVNNSQGVLGALHPPQVSLAETLRLPVAF